MEKKEETKEWQRIRHKQNKTKERDMRQEYPQFLFVLSLFQYRAFNIYNFCSTFIFENKKFHILPKYKK
jgi:hypothetical protein